jgi:hypothetical protein
MYFYFITKISLEHFIINNIDNTCGNINKDVEISFERGHSC